ncbi:MAG: LAGLIDADG family homing endonuclease [Candidatus Methanofastidiosia archaeon]|jgi:replicative DNA helicase Mcm
MEFEDAMNRFRDFVETFPSMENPVYQQEIRRCRANYLRSLNVDFDHLLDHDYELAQLVIDEPQFALPACDAALETLYRPDERIDLHVRFYNVIPARVEIRDLRSEHINKLIQIEGVVRRISEVKPEIVEAVFECQRCGQLVIVEQDSHIFKKPTVCSNPACGRQGPFQLLEDQSKFVDWQSVRIQERPERLRGGKMPRAVNAIIRDDIVDRAQAGNRVNITGVLKTQQESARRGMKTTFNIYAEVNHVELREKEVEEIEITKEDEEEIKKLAVSPLICNKIVSSIAPAIYGHEDVKEAIALQLFAGVFRVLSDGTRLRGDSNILLVGDPGTAKSQILQYTSRLAPRGIYTSGKGVSGVGLTAAVVRDEMSGGWALEAGALVLADGGLCCIDELDKMSTDDRSAIHEALEQQSYHPDTEILFSTGKKVKIGEFVDTLMEKTPPVQGINCEILPVDNYELPALDGSVPVEKVSRHTAPDYFITIVYSNGRAVTVTPEHPVFVIDTGSDSVNIGTIPADKITPGMAIPGVKHYSIKEEPTLLYTKAMEKIRFPHKINHKLARLLGYITSTGHVYCNKKNTISEVIIFSFDKTVIEDAKSILQEEFGAYSFVCERTKGEPLYKLRCPCLPLYNFFKMNFPELVQMFSKKRVPHRIFQCSNNTIAEFLQGVKLGNRFSGLGETCFSAGSYAVASDYQDVLLCLGIQSVVEKILYNGRVVYQVVVTDSYTLARPEDSTVQAYPEVVTHERAGHGLIMVGEPHSSHSSPVKVDAGFNTSFPDITNLRVLTVDAVKEIPNTDIEWVYDVTVKGHIFSASGVILHNTISIAKAGVVATLNARTSVLAACNPKYGRFDSYKSIADQIDLPSTLLSRFDLVYIITDKPHEDTDRRIAEHIVNIHRRPDETVTQPIPLDLLEKYILYAKTNVRPALTKEAAQKLMNFYVEMRKGGESEDAPVPITARQLEALIRLSEARARMRLMEKVGKEDAEEVIRLFRQCLINVAMDLETGKVDIDTLMTGTRKSQRDKILLLRDLIEELDERNQGGGAEKEEVLKLGLEKGLSESFVREYLQKFKHEGDIYEPRPGFIKMLKEY